MAECKEYLEWMVEIGDDKISYGVGNSCSSKDWTLFH